MRVDVSSPSPTPSPTPTPTAFRPWRLFVAKMNEPTHSFISLFIHLFYYYCCYFIHLFIYSFGMARPKGDALEMRRGLLDVGLWDLGVSNAGTRGLWPTNVGAWGRRGTAEGDAGEAGPPP